jgi:hypothetical protein
MGVVARALPSLLDEAVRKTDGMGAITGSWERCERLIIGKRGTSGDDLGAYSCCYMRGTFTQPPLTNLGQEPAPQRRQPAVPGAVLLQ